MVREKETLIPANTLESVFDSHCHLNSDRFQNDWRDVVDAFPQHKVKGAMLVCCEPEDWPHTQTLLEHYPQFLIGAFALHPEYENRPEMTDDELLAILSHPQIHAVGETGLDFYWCKPPRDWQVKRFEQHIALARGLQKPLIIHARDSEKDALDVLERTHAGDMGFVMHCFMGSDDDARRAVDLGGMVSFTGSLTFAKNDALRQTSLTVPLEHLLLETDAPYMAPVPYRGKRAEPQHVWAIAHEHARLRDIPVDEVARVTTANALKLFRWQTHEVSLHNLG